MLFQKGNCLINALFDSSLLAFFLGDTGSRHESMNLRGMSKRKFHIRNLVFPLQCLVCGTIRLPIIAQVVRNSISCDHSHVSKNHQGTRYLFPEHFLGPREYTSDPSRPLPGNFCSQGTACPIPKNIHVKS
jgi:hypothetical protein